MIRLATLMKRAVIVLAVSLVILLVVQIVFKELEVHAVNPYVDRSIHGSMELNIDLVMGLLLILVFRGNTARWMTSVAAIVLAALLPIAGCNSLVTAIHVSEAMNDRDKRMDLASADGWTYYARTLRRSALDDELRVDVLKERPLASGLVVRKVVVANELRAIGLSVDSVNARYLRFYIDGVRDRWPGESKPDDPHR
jgi:hypothetical protein